MDGVCAYLAFLCAILFGDNRSLRFLCDGFGCRTFCFFEAFLKKIENVSIKMIGKAKKCGFRSKGIPSDFFLGRLFELFGAPRGTYQKPALGRQKKGDVG